MSEESKTIKLKSPNGTVEEFTMKYSAWLDDQSDQMRLVDTEKNINIKELWLSRMERATGVPRIEIMRYPNWKMSALILKWFEMNDVTKATFLEEAPQNLNDISNSTSP